MHVDVKKEGNNLIITPEDPATFQIGVNLLLETTTIMREVAEKININMYDEIESVHESLLRFKFDNVLVFNIDHFKQVNQSFKDAYQSESVNKVIGEADEETMKYFQTTSQLFESLIKLDEVIK